MTQQEKIEKTKLFLLENKFIRNGKATQTFSEDEVEYLFQAYKPQDILDAIAFMYSMRQDTRKNIFCQKSYLLNAINSRFKPGK